MTLPMTFAPIAREEDAEATALLLIEAARRGGLTDAQIAWAVFFADDDIREELIDMVWDIFNDLDMLAPEKE